VARRGLLVLLGVVIDLEGGHPRSLGKIEDPGVLVLSIPR
jgi:hypothetical protein